MTRTINRANCYPNWETLNNVTGVDDAAGYGCPNEDDATVVCDIHLLGHQRDSVVAVDLVEVVVVGELLMSCSKLSLNRYYHVADDIESVELVVVVVVDVGAVADDGDGVDHDEQLEHLVAGGDDDE